MAQRLFHNITKGIAFRLHSLFRYPLIMRKRCREAATTRLIYELGVRHKLIAVDNLPCEVEDVTTSGDAIVIPDILVL